MTFNAIALNGKGTRAIMAASAGFTLLHLSHGHMRITFISFKDGSMTIGTCKHTQMLAVFEDNSSKIRDDY
jgi:hypothetical protein